MIYLMQPMDFHGAPQTTLKKILASEELWDSSLFLCKFGEGNREAFFAFQPESCLFSFALWEAGETAGESQGGEAASEVWPLSRQAGSPLPAC